MEDYSQSLETIQDGGLSHSSKDTGWAMRYAPAAPPPTALPSPSASTSAIRSFPEYDPPITSSMPTTEVITRLEDHGCQNIIDHLDLHSFDNYPLFSGGFGDVYRGKLTNGSHVAIKTMRIHINAHEAQKPLKNAARELHAWSKCQHPNVLPLLGLAEFRNQIGMVSHWMQNGNLPSYIAKHPETDRFQMSIEISKGLTYLHAANIIHGDLKGLNVLISDVGTAMLTDFGNAILQDSTLNFTATTEKHSLSPRWAAPELMDGPGMHSFAADVYALGMTILETITGKKPYSEKSDHGVYAALLLRKELPQRPRDSIPPGSKNGDSLWELLTTCWAFDPQNRPSAGHVRDTMHTIAAMKYLRNAIRAGDRLPNLSHVDPAERRAVIVAPHYWENDPGTPYAELPFTVNDAFQMHQTLGTYNLFTALTQGMNIELSAKWL
ncbi:kinase-like protein [Ceratobasidium sp. AG-I]|nr:kinase-like protein [Ceratobasidium sp. AG-I]